MTVKHEFGTPTLRSADFDPETGHVSVAFASGPPRTYAGFTAEEFAEWCAAEKPGAWFNNNVRQKAKAHPEIVAEAPAEEPVPAPAEAPRETVRDAVRTHAREVPTPAAPPARDNSLRARLRRCLNRANGRE